jgi:hypothetical protein
MLPVLGHHATGRHVACAFAVRRQHPAGHGSCVAARERAALAAGDSEPESQPAYYTCDSPRLFGVQRTGQKRSHRRHQAQVTQAAQRLLHKTRLGIALDGTIRYAFFRRVRAMNVYIR